MHYPFNTFLVLNRVFGLGCNLQGGLGRQCCNILHCKGCLIGNVTRNAAKMVEGYDNCHTYATVSLFDCNNFSKGRKKIFFFWSWKTTLWETLLMTVTTSFFSIFFFILTILLQLGPSLKLLATINLWLPLNA